MPTYDTTPYPATFNYAVQRTLEREGVFSDVAADRGGPTKYGITAAVAQRNRLNIRELTVDQAVGIYYRDYWMNAGCPLLASKYVAAELFDTAVLCGPSKAALFLQTAFNVLFADTDLLLRADGVCGPMTAAAINSKVGRWEKALLNAANAEQYAYFKAIVAHNSTQQAFMRGWCGKRLDVPDDAREP